MLCDEICKYLQTCHLSDSLVGLLHEKWPIHEVIIKKLERKTVEIYYYRFWLFLTGLRFRRLLQVRLAPPLDLGGFLTFFGPNAITDI